METIQVVLGKPLLRAADRAAQRLGQNRSALIRDALRSHLDRLSALEREERDRQGYERQPESAQDAAVWEKVAKWPED
ncbi:MAG: ribbon-helix-helix protein, CopG family [Acidobacteria bacterium]|nr:ribbon-helix-helix protein, CopG family [Acidobacteriota bacterium]